MERKRNIDFDSEVEVHSLKDAVWRLTTRVYLLEDFIAEKFGEVLSPHGYTKVSLESEVSLPSETKDSSSKINKADESSNGFANSRRGKKRRKRSHLVVTSEVEDENLNIEKIPKIFTIDIETETENDALVDPLVIHPPQNSEEECENELLIMPKIEDEVLGQDSDQSDGDDDFLNDESESDKGTNDLPEEKDPDFYEFFKSGETGQLPDKVLKYVQSIRRQQLIMKVKLDALSKIMPTLLDKVEKPEDSSTIESSAFSLPMETVPDFWSQNNFFVANQTEKEKLIVMLGAIGGNNGNQTTYRVMAALMTDELMFQFTGKGRTGKENFSSSVFLGCVCAAVRRNPKSLRMTDKEIEDRIDYWLRKAGTRLRKVNSLS